jgi:hypothetical protein
MPEANPAASTDLERGTAPREREGPPLVPLLVVGLLVLLTVVAIRVGEGNVALALAPSLVAMLLLALWLAPLRVPMLLLLVLAWVIEAPGDGFANYLVMTPWRRVGELLWGKLNNVIPISALVFTGFDLVVLLLFGIIAYRQLYRSTLDRSAEWVDTREPGAFVWLSLLAALWMGAYGLARGGSFRFILWQMIRWLYIPIVYGLMRQALRGGVDVPTVGKLILGVGLFRAGEVILIRSWFPSMEVLPQATTHADSVLFTTCVCILLAMLLEMPGKRTLKLCLLLLPFYVWAMKGNARRLVWAEVIMGAGMIWLMTPWRPIKVVVARALVAAALPLMIYVSLGWNSNSGIFSPVHKMRSLTDA